MYNYQGQLPLQQQQTGLYSQAPQQPQATGYSQTYQSGGIATQQTGIQPQQQLLSSQTTGYTASSYPQATQYPPPVPQIPQQYAAGTSGNQVKIPNGIVDT